MFLSLVYLSAVHAAVLSVDPSGGGDFLSLDDALTAAADGDTISLASGTYPPAEITGPRVLTLVAAEPSRAFLSGLELSGADVTIADVRFVDGGLRIAGGEVELENVVFQAFSPMDEPALSLTDGAEVALRGSWVDKWSTPGAPLMVDELSRLEIVDTRMHGCRGSVAGGVVSYGSLLIADSYFGFNIGDEGPGALQVFDGDVEISGALFRDNQGKEGGAINMESAGQALIYDTRLVGNEARFDGGQLRVGLGARASLTRVQLEGGTASRGGALAVAGGLLYGRNLLIYEPEATLGGGGLLVYGGEADLRYTTLFSPTAPQGAQVQVDGGLLRLSQTILASSQGPSSIYLYGGDTRLEDVLLDDPQAIPIEGGTAAWVSHVFSGPAGFLSPVEEDFSLTPRSVALDAARTGEADPDGSPADLGWYGGPWAAELADIDADGVVHGLDCDDYNAAINPFEVEVWYDGVDADCDGANDYDADGDGYEAAALGGSDCDDTDGTVHPGAWEGAAADGVDFDCDGLDVVDADRDGFPAGIDCDDASADVWPGAVDTWYDGVDADCAGNDDFDQDGDGVGEDQDCDDLDRSVSPATPEVAGDGIDQDCDGEDTELLSAVVDIEAEAERSPVSGHWVEPAGCASAGSQGGRWSGLLSLGLAALFLRRGGRR